jgi:hypothetical protein
MSKKRKRPPHNALFAIVHVAHDRGEDADFDGAFSREHNTRHQARRKCEAFGTDAMVEAITAGAPYRLLAGQIGVSVSALWDWIAADPARKQRCEQARANAAVSFDEMAEHVLLTAPGTAPEIMRANYVAQHYRWRAKVVNPKVYGDKAEVQHTHRLSVADALKQLDERRRQEAQQQKQ